MGPITVFPARQVVTMNPAEPLVEAVAVADGRVLVAGSLDECRSWGPHEIDDRFADLVIVPGMIEAHAHVLEGVFDRFPYAGWFERRRSDGSTVGGVRSYDALLDMLRSLDAETAGSDVPLVVGGFDPIYFEGVERLGAEHLDRVSTTRPIFVFHANAHVATVNTAMLERHGIDRNCSTPGVARGPDGAPNGELQEMPAMSLASSGAMQILGAMFEAESIERFGAMARNQGVTMVADLAAGGVAAPDTQSTWHRVVDADDFPARVVQYHVPAFLGAQADWSAAAARCDELRSAATDKLRTGGVKIVLDGSIQGFTAKMGWPGYYRGEDHGLWLVPPEQLVDVMRPFHERRINIHTHCNGDLTIDVCIDAVEQLVCEVPWLDHRHTVQHCQLTTAAQFRRMATLGMCANLFANHLWYWGDQHHDLTVGPERARRMEAAATARRAGVSISLHSDANVTPLGQLHSMWSAVNRTTPSGRVLGENERLTAEEALEAVTIGAAYQMHLDAEAGSIECGKWADFTVLERNPLEVEPESIRDIGVWGTVVGGRAHRGA